jgi:hypothetical protein
MKIYDKKYKVIESSFKSLRQKIEAEMMPFITEKALSLKCDLINTQWTLSRHDREEGGKRFEEFHDFINLLEDDFKLAFYFEVVDGKFYWLYPHLPAKMNGR